MRALSDGHKHVRAFSSGPGNAQWSSFASLCYLSTHASAHERARTHTCTRGRSGGSECECGPLYSRRCAFLTCAHDIEYDVE
eukprot:4967622-Pleurochrysis_carterae.AAC.1